MGPLTYVKGPHCRAIEPYIQGLQPYRKVFYRAIWAPILAQRPEAYTPWF